MEAAADTYIKGQTRSAKKIPYWLWVIIAKILGIKLSADEKPIVSAVLHIATFGSAAALFCTNLAYQVSAVTSNFTKTDLLDGMVSVMVMSYFCGLGVYSHRLGYRLFVHPKFLDMMRLHSKTVFKLNAAFLLFLILSMFVIILNVASVSSIYPRQDNITDLTNTTNQDYINPCQLAQMNVAICQTFWISQIIFSLFFLVWNLLVSVVLVSVARTQTIHIRRFLRELEQDALLLDRKLNASYSAVGSRPVRDDLKNLIWSDDDQIGDMFKDAYVDHQSGGVIDDRVNVGPGGENDLQLDTDRADSRSNSRNNSVSTRSTFQPLDTVLDEDESSIVPHILTEQEIMHKYWKITMNVRLASVALQRWMSSIIGLITTWSAIRMVYWLSHTPTWSGVTMFAIPLLLLPLLSSSYAEVNYEGAKIIQSILPTESRVQSFQYLYGHPVQMNVYGHSITYGTIGTVVAGILAAFASKILLQEISAL